MKEAMDELMKEYQGKFSELEDKAFRHHKAGETEKEKEVLKRMAGIKMMMDGLKKMQQ